MGSLRSVVSLAGRPRLGIECLLLIALSFVMLACDPEEVINDYFRQMGLTRLAVLQTDVQPGTVILMKGAEAFLADHILDYVNSEPNEKHDYGAFGGSAQADVDAVLRRVSENRQLTGKIATNFLVSVFRLNPSLDLGLTDSVRIELSDAKVRKMKVASLEKFLTRTDSQAFQVKVREWTQRGLTAFVAYEVYRAKSIHLESDEGKDIAPSLKANAITPLSAGGDIGVSYKKVTANRLVVASTRYYAFAVRTAKLEWVEPDHTVRVDRTEFVKPKEWGIKSAGTDDQYAAPLIPGYKPVTVRSDIPPEL